ncbi:MAG: glycosyltransferase, partial [bacterium]
MPQNEGLSIVQVCPRPWDESHEITEFISRTSDGLAARGHRVAIAAPTYSRTAVRESRKSIDRAVDASDLFVRGRARLIAIGQTLPLPTGARRKPPPLPLDLRRTLEQILNLEGIDIVHVHDPFAPSAGSIALRHSRSLNVATFHEVAERAVATQVTRPLVELLFGRADSRMASYRATAEILERSFPGEYLEVGPGVDQVDPFPRRATGAKAPIRIVYCATEERGALRLVGSALRRLLPLEGWELVVWAPSELDTASRLGARLRTRLTVLGPEDASPDQVLAGADIACFASSGVLPAAGRLTSAVGGDAAVVASGLDLYEEVLADGERGLLFPVGDAQTLSDQIGRLIENPKVRRGLAAAGRKALEGRTWDEAIDEIEGEYTRIASRRHDPAGDSVIRRRIRSRPFIHCDLHMHTDHSPDCATPAEVLLETAKERGLGAIAITDHNEISGAFEAREIAERIGGIKVIVAEEVKTASEGEVIGLFIEEKIDRGMSLAETIAEIRRQGGLVYVPHPFDRLHAVPDYEHLTKVVDQIDILEIFN